MTGNSLESSMDEQDSPRIKRLKEQRIDMIRRQEPDAKIALKSAQIRKLEKASSGLGFVSDWVHD